MCDQKKPNDWFCCSINDELVLEVRGKGRGGMKAFKKCLDDNCGGALGVGCFRVTAVDARGSTTSYRTKLVLVVFSGHLPAASRTKMKAYTTDIVKHFPHSNLIQSIDLDDFSKDNLEKLFRSSGGAHQPTHFDFTNDEVDNS